MKKIYSLFLLMAMVCLPLSSLRADELTVADGTATNSYLPIYGLYVDTKGTHGQCLYPASLLGNLENGQITKLTFYLSSSASEAWTGTIQVSLGETDETALTTTFVSGDLTQVYSGTLDPTGSTMVVNFATPFTYTGGNLILDFYVSVGGNYKSTTFYGVSDYTASGHYSYSTGNTTVAFLPKVTFEYTPGEAPACPKPSSLVAGNIAHSSAVLSWTEKGEATAWQICVNDNESKLFDAEATSYTLEDLTPLTAYSVKVRANCGSEQSEWSSPVSFSTTAKATEVGESWSDNFEGDACDWELINGTNTNAWAWGTATNNGGTHALYVSKDGGTTNEYSTGAVMVYASKLLQFADGKYQFTYDWKANGESNYDYLRVALVPASVTLAAGTSIPSGFSTTGLPTSWVALDGGSKLNLVTAWQNMSQAVNVTAGNYYLVVAWRNDGSGGSQAPAAVDNFSIVKLACPYDVAGLAVAEDPAVTTSTATITWTAGGAEQWQVAYSLDNTFPEKGTETTYTKAASVDLTNLSSSSVYYVKVRAYCDGEDFGAWSAPISFVTACEAITSYPWSENFDGYELSSAYTPSARILPTCWNVINTCTGSDYKWYPTIYYYSYTDHSHSSPNMLRLYSYYSSYGSSAQPQYAILPEMKNLDDKRIVFWAKGYNANSTIKVGRMTDPADASTFTQIGDELALTTDYQKFTINLSGTGNYIVIMIDAATSSRSYNGAYIDDIVVEDVPSCMEPSGLAFVSATTTSATFNWTAGGSETAWDIYYSTKNVAPTAETTPSIAAATVKAIPSGLSASTTYYVWVRAHCSDSDQSPWMGGISFQTECDVVTSFPWHENFDERATGDIDIVCWENKHITGTGTYLFQVSEGSYANANTNVGKLPDMSAGTLTLLSLPAFSIPTANTYQFALDVYRNHSSYSEEPEEGIRVYASLSDTTDASAVELAFIPREYAVANAHVGAESEVGWYTYEFVIPMSGDVHILLRGESKYATATYFDDLFVELIPSCLKPVAPACNAKTAHTATLSWTAGDEGQNAWQIAVDSIANFNPDTLNAARIIDVTSNPAVINGLNANTTFYAYVRANCGSEDGVSAWSKAKTTFKTLAGNLPVQNVAVHAPSLASDAATITWQGAATNDLHASFELYYSKLNQLPEELASDSLFTNIADTFKTISGLDAETTYYVWVRDNCGTDGLSAWTSSLSFTTLANCPVPGTLSATDIEAKSAKIAWAVGQNDSYNVQYRIAALDNVIYSEGFENGMNGWSTNNAVTSTGISSSAAHSELKGFYFYYGYSNQYLISSELPALDVDGTLKFYYKNSYSGTAETFKVGYSSTDKSTSSFTYGDVLTVSDATWHQYSASIPAGTKYISIQYTSDDKWGLYVDDIEVLGAPIVAGAWQDGGNATAKELTVTGLTPQTKYEAQVRGICGESETEWSESVFFTTIASCMAPVLANPVILPDGATFSWTAGNGETQFEYACVEKDAEVEKWISLPANTMTVTINGKASGSNYDFYVRASCGDEDWSEAVKKTFTPLCKAPTAPQVAAITTTTATISWTAADDEAIETYQYVVLPAASQLDWTSAEIVSATSAQLKDLNASTAYKAYIRSYYSEASQSTYVSVSFTTECEAVASFPWSENFDERTTGNINIPCWENEHIAGSGSYVFQVVTESSIGNSTKMAKLNDMQSGNQTLLSLPVMNIPAADAYEFDIDVYRTNYSSIKNAEGLLIYVSATTELADTVLLGFIPRERTLAHEASNVAAETADDWYSYSFSLPVSGDCRIFIKGVSQYGSATRFDNLVVQEIPSCQKPTALAVSNIAATEVTLAWTENGEATEWQICINGDEENLIDANTNPYVLQNLVSSTEYSVKVRANCGDDKSEWSAAIEFNTLCEAVRVSATNAFEEGFEDTDFVPTCWESIASGSYKWTRATSSTYVHTGSASAYSGYYGDVYLVMPELAIADDDNVVKLTFWSSNSYSTSYDKNSVVLLGESETELWSPESVTSSWTETTIDLSAYKGQTIQLAFKYEGDNAHGWYVDDVKVEFEKGQATAIDAIESKEQAVKFIRENNLYIMLNGVIYDATGRKVETK